MSPNCYLINQMKKIIFKYILRHRLTLGIVVEMWCLKVIEVPSLLTNPKNVWYVDAKRRYINTSKLKSRALLFGSRESSLSALDSTKIEKEEKLCYKFCKSRINNVLLKSSFYNCYLILGYLIRENIVGEMWWKFSSAKLLPEK